MVNHDGKVTIGTALDNKGLEKGIGNISGSLGGLKSVLGKLGGVVAAAFSVKAIVDFSKAAIELGSDLEEVQNVVDVSFGSMAGACEEFASTAITKFGMSELAAKQTASTYMAMAKGMGVVESAASDMSITLARLSGDVASFYNLDQEDAAKKLQGVFTGESEALKSLGVVMTQTNLKQFALERGMNANIEAMSQAELVALRYAFVTDALSLAAGDFERTQDSWANQTRILSMQWQQFMGTMGQSLTTILTPAVKVLNNLVGVLNNLASKISTVVASLFGKATTQTEAMTNAAEKGFEAEKEFAEGINEAGNAAKKTLSGFDELNKLQDKDTPSVSTSAGGDGTNETISVNVDVEDTISPAIQSLIDRIKKFFDPIRQIDLTPAKEAFAELGDSLSDLGAKISEKLEWAWFNILVPLGKWTIEKAVPKVAELMAAAFETFGEVIDAVWPALEKLWNSFLKPLAEWTGEVIIDALGEVTDIFRDLADLASGKISFSEFLSGLTPAQSALASLATSFVTIKSVAFGMKSFKAVTDFVKSIKSLNAVGTIGKLGEVFAITSSGAGTFSEAMDFAFGKGSSLIAGLAIVAAGIALIVTGVKDFIKNGASLKNTIMIIGGAIAVAIGLATAGLSVVVSAIVAAVAAVAAFTAAILLEEPAIMSTKEAQEQLTTAKAAAAEAENGYINAVDAAESALTRLKDAEAAAGVTGADLYAQVQNGTLDYANMTAAQKAVYKAYLDNEEKQKALEESTAALNEAKKAETLASLENEIALGKEAGSYDKCKESILAAYNEGSISAEECRDLLAKSMSEMSDDAQQTFMEDIPGDIKSGLDPNKYETTRKKMGDWFSKVGKGFIENIWNPIKEFWNKYIAPIFTAKFWSKLAKDCGNGFIIGFEGAINGLIWMFEGLINLVVDGLNLFIGGLSEVTGAAGDLIGVDLRIPKIPRANLGRVSIPRLAQGAVIPPNKEFLAVLGDQRHGTNVEAPLSIIQEAVALVMQDQTQAILAGFEASVGVQREILEAVLGIQIGDDVIGNAVARYSRKQAVIRGGAL